MTADARRDEALRLVDEAIARCEAATEGTWRAVPISKGRADIRTEPELGWDYRGTAIATAADSDFGACPDLDAAHIAYHDPATMLRLHRANKAILEEHAPRKFDSLRDFVHFNPPPELFESLRCTSSDHDSPWPCPTAERVIAAYTGEGW